MTIENVQADLRELYSREGHPMDETQWANRVSLYLATLEDSYKKKMSDDFFTEMYDYGCNLQESPEGSTPDPRPRGEGARSLARDAGQLMGLTSQSAAEANRSSVR